MKGISNKSRAFSAPGIHTHGTSSGTGQYALWHLPLSGYVVKSGDTLSWRQYETGGGRGGVVISFTDSSTANWNTYDQNGEIINSAHTQDQWMQRTVDLTLFAGKTIASLGGWQIRPPVSYLLHSAAGRMSRRHRHSFRPNLHRSSACAS